MSSPILPVVFGYDIAAYSFARLMHENGLRPLVISEHPRGPINDSSLFDLRFVAPGTCDDPAKFIPLLHSLAEEFADRQLVLLLNTDEGVDCVAAHRAELEDRWFLPYAPAETVTLANNKARMAELIGSLGYGVPARATVELGGRGADSGADSSTADSSGADSGAVGAADSPAGTREQWTADLAGLRWPVVVKPEDGGLALGQFWGRGLRKVLPIATLDEALDIFDRWQSAGVATRLIVQELIPGDDTTQWVVNGYVDREGHVTAIGCGRVLLGLHQPEYLGNAGLILVTDYPRIIGEATTIVTAAGIRGFFSMDVKIDPRDGEPKWLDLNPRIGRGHYYLKAGGLDLGAAMLDDMAGRPHPFSTPTHEALFAIIPAFLANSTYVRDPELLAHVKRVRKAHGVVNPLASPDDRNLKRTFYRLANNFNQARRMKQFYPKPTESGF